MLFETIHFAGGSMCQRSKFAAFLILFTVLLCANLAYGQFAQRGGIEGNVFDSNGAAIPGAQVSLIDVAHNSTVDAVANDTGHFQFTGLAAGQYLLSVRETGFETTKSDPITVSIGETTRYDLKLATGSVTETVTVTSSSPLLETGHASVGSDITQKQMEELPMNGLNFTSLAELTPGISTYVEKNINPGGSFAVGSQFASGGISFTSGGVVQGSRDNGYYINGVNINDNWESSISYLPSSNALENAKISVTDFSAANGHDFSTFSVQTKSGSTKFHGSVYEHLENDALNAIQSYDKATGTTTKPTLRRNQFGFGVGGPVIIPKVSKLKDHLFFFANYENFIEHDGSQPVKASVPSTKERTGDFSELLPEGIQLYNPFTTTYDSGGNSSRTPVANNRLDLAGLVSSSAASKAVLALYPTPNIDTPSDNQNYRTTQQEAFNNYHFDSRFDVRISSRDNAFITWSKQHGTNNNAGGVLPDFVWDNDDASWLVTVNEMHQFTPNLTNEFVFGKGYGSLTIVSPAEIAFLHSSANPIRDIFKNTGTGASQGVFGIDFDDYVSPGFDQDFLASNNALQFSDNVNWTHRRHAMTFGFNYFRKGEYDWDFGRYVSFGSNYSRSGSLDGHNGGDNMADLVMGTVKHIHQLDVISGADDTAPELNVRFPFWGFYANDKFQFTPKLTLSVGLRYDLNLPMYDPQKLCCAVYQPNAQGGVLAIPGVASGLPQHYLSAAKANFAPRISFAYSATNRDVIRAGYGVFYDSGASQISSATGFANGGTPGGGLDVTSSLLGYHSDTPAVTMDMIFPQEPVVPKGQYDVSTGAGQGYFGDGWWSTVYYQDQKSTVLPYYQRYVLDVQHMLNPQTSVTVSYAGSQGRKGTNYTNINLPTYANNYVDSDAFNAARPNNIGRFGDIYVQRGNLNSFYNSGIISFQHRFSQGYQFLSNYTFGKTVSDYPYVNNLAYNGAYGAGGSGFQYPNVRDRGETTGSHHQRFVMSGIWSPIYGRNWASWSKAILTDWRLSGILTLESGDRMTVVNGWGTSAEDFAGFDQLNVTGNPNISHGKKTFTQQFNSGAFSVPAEHLRGNSGLGTIQGPGQNNVDLSLSKTFKIWESINANIRADAYNAFNHSQWTSVQTTSTKSNSTNIGSDPSKIYFGTVTGSREARITQISMKISF
jgi:hypothetical protein